ncbi:MAG TPA: prepilin-type N-terminal cleavage/methylation domain-containing protein [Candidatus Acidoferrum sp.]|nr:prepilin-type N-terminal cleavage/methylation domain-containing protein [Candidatus Acidoferrum sp.]
MKRRASRRNGFSLIELMTALAILVLVCGVAFELLFMSMKKYHSDSQLLNTFQEARFGLDQMVRDINDSGYPPRNQTQGNVTPMPETYAVTPFAWGPSGTYPNSPCAIGSNCTTPNGYDLIVETDIDPQNKNYVEWVRYKLIGTTLYRGVITKSNSTTSDPDGLTSGFDVLVPYVQNVMNKPPAAQLATLQAAHPTMYPGGNPVPIFQYFCESTPQPVKCDGTGVGPPPTYSDPKHVVAVIITLIVQSPASDMQTGQPLVVQLQGEGRRVNPDY